MCLQIYRLHVVPLRRGVSSARAAAAAAAASNEARTTQRAARALASAAKDAMAARERRARSGRERGGAVHSTLHSVYHCLKMHGFIQPLNLKCDLLVSKIAFKFNLYRYCEACSGKVPGAAGAWAR
jgi:hypothetical protein